tara:strand:- start:174 stop:1658 length:1485 start_codon:yes stop_codon:yes gene_type:complete
MKRFSEQLHKEAQSVKLQAAQKTELRERLVSYMEYHPLPAEMKVQKSATRKKAERIKTEAFTAVSIPFSMLFKTSTAAAAFILVVVPFVAEKSVPGDALYAVKVQTEEIRGTLTFNTYQKVEWETERLNRRIAEARLLESEGRLTEEVEAEVAAAVKEHTKKAQQEIEVLRQQDADDAAIASIALDTTLEVQSQALKADGESHKNGVAGPSLIASVIDESRQQVENVSASTTQPSYAKLMARVEQNTTRMYELSNSLSGVAPLEQLQEVDRRIADLERAIGAVIELSVTDQEAARTGLIDVLQRSQKLIVYMTEIEVQSTVDIETLVPVVLTDEEKASFVAETTESIAEQVAMVENTLPQVEDPAVVEKVSVALAEIAAFQATLIATTTEFEGFKVAAADAQALLDDINLLIEQTNVQIVLPEENASSTATTTDETASSTEPVVEEPEETGTTTPEAVEEPVEEPEEIVEELAVEPETATTTEATEEEIVDTEI